MCKRRALAPKPLKEDKVKLVEEQPSLLVHQVGSTPVWEPPDNQNKLNNIHDFSPNQHIIML